MAQMIDARTAEMRARKISIDLGYSPEGAGRATRLERTPFGGPSVSFWQVAYPDVEVALSERGELQSFRYLSPAKGSSRAIPSDEDAWRLAEQTMAPLGVPPGLYRTRLLRSQPGDGVAGFTTLFFESRPSGYVALGGNQAMVAFRNDNLQIRTVLIGRHWNYEPPRIRISAAKAKEIAATETGTKAASWQGSLFYMAEGGPKAPKAIRELCFKRIMRLCYELRSSARGIVVVDSVTGDVVKTDSTVAQWMPTDNGKSPKKSLVYGLANYASPLPVPPVTSVPVARSPSPDDKIVRVARDYAVSLGHVPQGEGQIDKSDLTRVLGKERSRVFFEDAMITIDSNLRLVSYSWSGKLKTTKAPKAKPLVKVSDAWTLAEKTLARYSPSKGLVRNGTSGFGKDVRPDGVVYLHFNERPFGYEAEVGNRASVSFRVRDRQLMSIHIGRDWTYESPNVKISKAQAIAIAAAKMKAPKDGWKADLKYWVEIKSNSKNRVSRLCYIVYSRHGYVTVDSVTGDVVNYGTPPTSG